MMLETTSAGLGEGRAASPASDWTPKRLGAAPPDVIAKLRAEGSAGVIAACGIPPSLATANSDGTAQREGYRRFVATSVRPKALEIAAELSEKLERPISFNFDELRADDPGRPCAGCEKPHRRGFFRQGCSSSGAVPECGLVKEKLWLNENGSW